MQEVDACHSSEIDVRSFGCICQYTGLPVVSLALVRLSTWDINPKVLEECRLELFPCGIRIADAADRPLCDAGVGGAKAPEAGVPADLPPLILTTPKASAKQGTGTGDPDTLEGMDYDSLRIAEDGVVEDEGRAGGRGRD